MYPRTNEPRIAFSDMAPTGRAFALASLALMCATLAACDSGRRSGTARLQGTVTLNGQPLPADAQANVTFSPVDKGRTAGTVVANGEYDCPDVPLGKVRVYFSVMRPTGKMITESDNRPYPEVASIIAQKYASGIEIEVTDDNSNQDFDLEPAS